MCTLGTSLYYSIDTYGSSERFEGEKEVVSDWLGFWEGVRREGIYMSKYRSYPSV